MSWGYASQAQLQNSHLRATSLCRLFTGVRLASFPGITFRFLVSAITKSTYRGPPTDPESAMNRS